MQIQDFFPKCGWGVQRIPLFAKEEEVLCEVQKIEFFRGTDPTDSMKIYTCKGKFDWILKERQSLAT